MIRDGHRASEVITRLRALFARRPPGNESVDVNDAARKFCCFQRASCRANEWSCRPTWLAICQPLSAIESSYNR